MAKELGARSREELLREAERLYLDAAFGLTKLDARMKKAVRLVMLEKLSLSDAALKVKRPRQNVYRAVARIKPLLDLVKASTK